MFRLLFQSVLTLFCCLPLAHGALAQSVDSSLIDALRGGGFNIYFRHAQTDWSQTDRIRDADDIPSCDGNRVRQLSREGRTASASVGRAIRQLAIPVGRLLASPYCRTMDTARLMELGEVEATPDLMNLRSADHVGGRDAVVARARALLATLPAPGTNTLLVAHGNVARTATPVYPGEAEGVVFKPDGKGGFDLVGRIAAREWSELVERFSE